MTKRRSNNLPRTLSLTGFKSQNLRIICMLEVFLPGSFIHSFVGSFSQESSIEHLLRAGQDARGRADKTMSHTRQSQLPPSQSLNPVLPQGCGSPGESRCPPLPRSPATDFRLVSKALVHAGYVVMSGITMGTFLADFSFHLWTKTFSLGKCRFWTDEIIHKWEKYK